MPQESLTPIHPTDAMWKPSSRTSSSDSGAINGLVSPGFLVASGCSTGGAVRSSSRPVTVPADPAIRAAVAAATMTATAATAFVRRRCACLMALGAPGARVRALTSVTRVSSSWSRSGMGGFSILGSEEGGQGGATAGEAGLDGPLRAMLDPGDLADGELAEIVEHDGPPLCLWQLLERPDEGRGRLRRGRDMLRAPGAGQEPRRRPGPPPTRDRQPGRHLTNPRPR